MSKLCSSNTNNKCFQLPPVAHCQPLNLPTTFTDGRNHVPLIPASVQLLTPYYYTRSYSKDNTREPNTTNETKSVLSPHPASPQHRKGAKQAPEGGPRTPRVVLAIRLPHCPPGCWGREPCPQAFSPLPAFSRKAGGVMQPESMRLQDIRRFQGLTKP